MTISLSDFNSLSTKEKKTTLLNLKNDIGVSGISKAWGISKSKIYGMLKEFNIPMQQRRKNVLDKNESANMQNVQTVNTQYQTNELMDKNLKKQIGPLLEMDPPNDVSKLVLSIETQGSGSVIGETLQALLAVNPISNSHFQVNVTLQEI